MKHNHMITKSMPTSPMKLVEESKEFIDALASGNKILAQLELSDLYGALVYQASNLGVSLNDLKIASDATIESYKSGHYKSTQSIDDLKRWLVQNAVSITNEKNNPLIVWLNQMEYYLIFTGDEPPYVDIEHFHKVCEVVEGTLEFNGAFYTKGNLFHNSACSKKWMKTCAKNTIVRVVRENDVLPKENKAFRENLANLLGVKL